MSLISGALSNTNYFDKTDLTTTCIICSSCTVSTCSYCGETVCADDLEIHRTSTGKCQPWKVTRLPTVGRVLIATRDIGPWEAVLVDTALIMAPGDLPVCVGCLGEVSGEEECVRCKWPLCGEECQETEDHLEECRIFQSNNIVPIVESFNHNHWLYTTLAVLRVLLVKIKDTEGWKQIESLMDHWEERKQDSQVADAVKGMCLFFQKRCQLSWVTLKDVQHSFGVLKTNSVSLIPQEGLALYPLVSLLSHSCSPNLESVSDPSKTITMRAKIAIPAGEQLTVRYTHIMHSRRDIQAVLARDWLFVCACVRCQDLTELGSYFSSLKCSCGGYFTEKTAVKQRDIFICSQCKQCKDFTEKLSKFEEIEKGLVSLSAESNTIQEFCKLIEEDTEVHENLYIKTKVYIKFADIFQDTDNQDILADVAHKLKIALNTIQLIDRGSSRLMGKYMMVLSECQQKLLKNKIQKRDIPQHNLQKAIKELAMLKLTAMRMLSQHVI